MQYRWLKSVVAFLVVFIGGDIVALDFRIGVYNIHGAVGTDGNTDVARVARVLKASSPDIVGLNEVNRYTFGDRQDEELAALMGAEWKPVFGKTLNSFLVRDYGNAVLTRLPIISSQVHLYSKSPDLEQRGFMRVTVEKDGERIHFFTTHLGLNNVERQRHIGELMAEMAKFTDGYRVLVGDMNEQRGAAAVEAIAGQYKDSWGTYGFGDGGTFISSGRRIDFIFLDRKLAATSCYVPTLPESCIASDHAPVFAWLVDPTKPAAVVNHLAVAVNGFSRLQATDVVSPDPNSYTQGTALISTDGGAAGVCAVLFDDLQAETLSMLWNESFGSTPAGASPANWQLLFASAGGAYSGQVTTLGNGGERVWRQRSSNYAKYRYSPADYPAWRNYEFSARVQSVTFGGGAWRMKVYNYPVSNTAYESYKIEVRHDTGQMPRIRLMKGAQQLSEASMPEQDIDAYSWNVYGLSVRTSSAGTGQIRNSMTVLVNGKGILQAEDTVPDAPNAYTQGSVVISTIGGSAGDCEILVDDLLVRGWDQQWSEDFEDSEFPGWQQLYATPDTYNTTGVVESGGLRAWSQTSEGYLRYQYTPTPLPQWRNLVFSGRARTITFGGGKWRMNVYNYPAGDLGYETYKLEVNAGTTGPQLRLMKGGTALQTKSFADEALDSFQWQDYELSVRTFQPDHRVILKMIPSAVGDWWGY